MSYQSILALRSLFLNAAFFLSSSLFSLATFFLQSNKSLVLVTQKR